MGVTRARLRQLRSLVSILAVIIVLCFVINTFLLFCCHHRNDQEEGRLGRSLIGVNNSKESIGNKEHIAAIIEENIDEYYTLASQHNSALSLSKLSFEDLTNHEDFNIRGNDVIVFLHIQKTGGTTFGKHLVQDLDIERPCVCNEDKKKCKCVRPNAKSDEELWLFSRHSTGWKCGLHADWTELNDCLKRESTEFQYYDGKYSNIAVREPNTRDRRYLYVSVLREPIRRFISEYKHVQRGATWKSSRHICSGRPPTYDELPPCYQGSDWRDVTIEEFLSCKSNLALNRQTRMLANLTLIDCYNTTSMDNKLRDEIMLESAKENLKNMAFFGICDYQETSQLLFEKTFNMKFKKPFVQYNETRTSQVMDQFSEEVLLTIEQLNYLDIQLYDYALELFFKRYESLQLSRDLEPSANTNEK